MPVARRSAGWRRGCPRMTLIAALLVLPGVAPAQEKPQDKPAQPVQQPSANAAGQAPCAALAEQEIPLNQTLRATVTGTLSSGHLKPGKELWVNAAYGMVYPGCTLEAGAAIYGRVLAASSSKNPNASELSLAFDRVDCTGHGKQNMRLFLIGAVGPPDNSPSAHDAVPTEVRGSARQISDTVASTDAYDAKLNPGGTLHTVHPGIVVGINKLKLEPQGGPGCSARMSSTERNIELAPGTVLLFAVRSAE
jgi:hypothetical protein